MLKNDQIILNIQHVLEQIVFETFPDSHPLFLEEFKKLALSIQAAILGFMYLEIYKITGQEEAQRSYGKLLFLASSLEGLILDDEIDIFLKKNAQLISGFCDKIREASASLIIRKHTQETDNVH